MRIIKEIGPPVKGEFPLTAARLIPPDGAAQLRNLRVDDLRVHTPDLFALLAPTPTDGAGNYNPVPIIDIHNLQFFDGSVETLGCFYCSGIAANYLSQMQRISNNAWSGVALDNSFTGANTDRFSAVMAPWAAEQKGRLIISNGTKIKSWKGSTNAFADVSGGYPARYLLVGPDSRLFYAYTKEGGNTYPGRVGWSIIGLLNGTSADFDRTAGTGAGALDLTYDQWAITRLWNQLGRIFVGKERSLALLYPTGVPSDAYGREVINRDEGVFAAGSFAQHGNLAAFFTHRDVAVFDGTNVQSVGGAVRRELFRRLNYAALRQITTYVDGPNNRVGWGLPLDGSLFPTEIWWLSIDSGAWEKDTPFAHTALSIYTNVDVTYVDELVGTVNSLAGVVDDLSLSAAPRAQLSVGNSVGELYVQDPTLNSGSRIFGGGLYLSPAISAIGEEVVLAGQRHVVSDRDVMVLDEVHIVLEDQGRDYNMPVACTTDGGNTFTSIGTLAVRTKGAAPDRPGLVDAFINCRIPVGSSVQIQLGPSPITRWGFTRLYVKFDLAGESRYSGYEPSGGGTPGEPEP